MNHRVFLKFIENAQSIELTRESMNLEFLFSATDSNRNKIGASS